MERNQLNKIQASCFLLLASCFFSCSFNPPLQSNGSANLQGIWQQDSIGNIKQLLGYQLFNFRFSCDSVYLVLNNYSKVNTGADTCMNKGHWLEYVRANYDQRNDTLHVKGFYTDAHHRLKDERTCFNSGPYEQRFKVKMVGDSTIDLLPLSNSTTIRLKLIKKLSCVPQPLAERN